MLSQTAGNSCYIVTSLHYFIPALDSQTVYFMICVTSQMLIISLILQSGVHIPLGMRLKQVYVA